MRVPRPSLPRPLPTARTSARVTALPLPAAEVWRTVSEVGPSAWYVDALPLVVRGLLDRAVGGEGRIIPPAAPFPLVAGDRVGLWHVDAVRPPGLRLRGELALRAIVRAPGTVTLVTRVVPLDDDRTRVEQIVRLDPDGLLGLAYLTADLPARETVIELVHRRLLRELRHDPTREQRRARRREERREGRREGTRG
ncbi:DUF2867 domain-containing protein [Nocardioides sp. TRM66260-LWL]|uniref:DUF2867 domain-containing protein n=1 Tax=Nocardioides sp. TRM66260-LWL TaxID=2874478 RepID=UPI001CC404D7|nr:DUF2867 domain-containing protein [Nocardioides sp. TRM66260-LWL]MBZ5735502.1 DUF2867 domain-containing protein [Nocardioides sp. TRM66260-LWL]